MTIDWKEIWKIHSPYYKNGKFILELSEGKEIIFHPGAAFGDGSHPTTNLVLDNMEEHVKGKVVVDLGSGTGILSLAAAKYGAQRVYGLEIDEPSIENMKTNIKINSMYNVTVNVKPDSFEVVLINMISSEQLIALKNHPYLLKKGVTYLVSGVFMEERDLILKQLGGPSLISSSRLDQWALFIAKS